MSLEKQLADYGLLHEELVGPIEIEEITSPLTGTHQKGSRSIQAANTVWRRRYAGPTWAVAAFLTVIAVGALFLAFTNIGDQVADTSPTPTTLVPDTETMTDLEVIGAGVEALFSGEAEGAVELFGIEGGDAEAQNHLDDRIRREAAFQAAIGGRMTLDCTEQATPGVFTCNVPYQNAVTDAVGGELPGVPYRVVVQNGVITEFGIPHHIVQGFTHEFEFGDHMDDMAYFLKKVEGSKACGIDPRTAECAHLIRDHLDEWAAWCGRLGLTGCENPRSG